jgi:hypothetical protein
MVCVRERTGEIESLGKTSTLGAFSLVLLLTQLGHLLILLDHFPADLEGLFPYGPS